MMKTLTASNKFWQVITTVIITKLWVVGAAMVGTMALVLSKNYGII